MRRCTHDRVKFADGTFWIFCLACGQTWMATISAQPVEARPDIAQMGNDPDGQERRIDRSRPKPTTAISPAAMLKAEATPPRVLPPQAHTIH